MRQMLAVVGPTASGKTDVAIALAERLGTEIISADSMQFYRGMEIGTGQPDAEQRARVPHHFIGHLNPDEYVSAGAFGEQARTVVSWLNTAGKPAVAVGGSGLYIRALIDGLFEGPGRSCDIRQRLHAAAGAGETPALYAQLQAVDPEYAGKILPGDLRRIVRALEVFELTGKPLSAHHAEQQDDADPLDALQVGLDWPREVLYARINARVLRMFEAGLVHEVESLLQAGFETQLERIKSIGYREVMAHLRGESGLDETVAAVQMQHRRYAKRQLTWFRRDTRIHWVHMGDEPEAFHPERVVQRMYDDGLCQ